MIRGQVHSIEAEIKKKENTFESTGSQSLNFSKILYEYNEMPDWHACDFNHSFASFQYGTTNFD